MNGRLWAWPLAVVWARKIFHSRDLLCFVRGGEWRVKGNLAAGTSGGLWLSRRGSAWSLKWSVVTTCSDPWERGREIGPECLPECRPGCQPECEDAGCWPSSWRPAMVVNEERRSDKTGWNSEGQPESSRNPFGIRIRKTGMWLAGDLFLLSAKCWFHFYLNVSDQSWLRLGLRLRLWFRGLCLILLKCNQYYYILWIFLVLSILNYNSI